MKTEPETLDGTDLEILGILEAHARTSYSDIGRQVSLTPPAVKRRIDKLEEAGVIVGYTTKLNHQMVGRPVEAFTELRFVGNTKVDDIKNAARGMKEVVALYTTAGDPDAILHIRAADMKDLTEVVDRFRRSGRVTGTKTLLVLEAISEDAN